MLQYWDRFFIRDTKPWYYGGKVDYMDIQYARDLTMHSVLGDTTQESLSRFLQDRKDVYSLCVVRLALKRSDLNKIVIIRSEKMGHKIGSVKYDRSIPTLKLDQST